MKTLIKILIIVVAIAGIAWGVWSLMEQSSEIQPATVSTQENGAAEEAETPLSEYEQGIKNQLDERMPENAVADLSQWKAVRKEIDNGIETAATMTLGDGSTQVSKEEALRCHKMVFNRYASAFLKQCDTFFAQSSWNETEMNALKAEATGLLGDRYCDRGSTIAVKLSKVSDNVSMYHGAKSLIAKAGSCNSLAAVKACRGDVAKYKQAPLTNCPSIMSQLNGVAQKATNSYARVVASKANTVARNFDTYSSNLEFNRKYREALDELNGFVAEFGSTAELSSAKSALQNAKIKAPKAYARKEMGLDE